MLAVDVSPWLRPDANACADRAFCHTFGRGEGKHQMVPGWPYSVVAALETGRTSWTAVLDAVRLEPGTDVAAVTTVQVREVVERLVAAGQWRPGDYSRSGPPPTHDRTLLAPQCPLQRREELQQLGPQPVGLTGAVVDQVEAAGGEGAQVDGYLVAGPQETEVLAHACLVGDDERVLLIRLGLVRPIMYGGNR